MSDTFTGVGGPRPKAQNKAILQGSYWYTFNSSILNNDYLKVDKDLRLKTNAFKAFLQTYGPDEAKKSGFDIRENKGADKKIWHTHLKGADGTTYVLEWEILDKDKRHLSLNKFGPHENFRFTQSPKAPVAINALICNKESKKIFKDIAQKKENLNQPQNRCYKAKFKKRHKSLK